MKIFQTFWGGQYWNDPTLRSKSFQCQVQSTDKIPENARFWPFELWSLHGSFLPEQSPTKNSDSIVQQLKTSTVLGGGREGEGWNHHCWWSSWIQERRRGGGAVLKRWGGGAEEMWRCPGCGGGGERNDLVKVGSVQFGPFKRTSKQLQIGRIEHVSKLVAAGPWTQSPPVH